MTSLRQIEANRRNARLSTGPVTEEGKRRSRQNAVRHGLTAETVIDALEDAQDYAAFEMAVTADYDAPSAVERELVLRLASLLWRLRRATAIESGLFKIRGKAAAAVSPTGDSCETPDIGDNSYCGFTSVGVQHGNGEPSERADSLSTDPENPFEHLTLSYLRLTNLGNAPLDRLSRYECTLWRQARQTLFALRKLDLASARFRRRGSW